MLDIIYKSAGSFTACFLVDTLFGVQNIHSPLLNFHSSVGPLTKRTFLMDVIANPYLSYLFVGILPHVTLGYFAHKNDMLLVTTVWAGYIGYLPCKYNIWVDMYNLTYAMSFGFMASQLLTSDDPHAHLKIVLAGVLHNALCSFYWWTIQPTTTDDVLATNDTPATTDTPVITHKKKD